MKKLPDAEFDIMKAIWQMTPPVTAGMIQERLTRDTGKTCTLQTLHTLLGRLVDRGFLSFEKARKDKLFRPLVTRDAYLQVETQSFIKQYHEGSLLQLVSAAYQGESLSEADIGELIEWVDALRGKPS
ncbi:MAG: BlaI/MecI/CopY family transcriptional regulator [Oscillospiraceae bacterium]|nr:BlaI/MecI/CopY family transcriptional regulator [Oscillospiraceae bacterium]